MGSYGTITDIAPLAKLSYHKLRRESALRAPPPGAMLQQVKDAHSGHRTYHTVHQNSLRATQKKSKLYQVLNSNSTRLGSVVFNRCLALLIISNVLVDVMITVEEFNDVYGEYCKRFETFSSLLFIAEYAARFSVCGERLKYRGARGKVRFVCSSESIIDLLSFLPWIFEKVAYGGKDVPSTAFVRVFRMLRILKTERFTHAVDAIVRVLTINANILGIACVMACMLVLFTSTLLYYANRDEDETGDFSSIPATMYLSILMLTGQGEPDGELTTVTKVLCVFTALFSVAMVAIPASMLTFGFEIEATRLVKKRRERRLRRRLRATTGDDTIASCSDSEVDDARLLARERRNRRRLPNACDRCRGQERRQRVSLIADAADVETEYELSSSEDEYETLILGQTEQEAMDSLREDLQKEAYKHFLMIAKDELDDRLRAPAYDDLLAKIRSHEFARARAASREPSPVPR